jgi:retron-type reverse transcriptase
VIYNPEILKIAYESIKSNPGNMVRGTDKETLDGISEKWFEKTSEDLQWESYQPRPARRIYIPKANGKMRPLGISSPRDKVVQQATRIVMEEVLERTFHRSSNGFRPSRGCHTALKCIRG